MPRVYVCKKCSLSIDHNVQRSVMCEGDCARSFHMECAQLSEKEVTVKSINYIWLCNECLDSFRKARDDRASREYSREGTGLDVSHDMESSGAAQKSMENEIAQLKHAVAGIIETLAKYTPTVPTANSLLRHSTPVSSNTLQDGTNASSFSAIDNEGSQQQDGMDDRTFSLLLTNIDANVAVRDVHQMVVQALGVGSNPLDHIDVVKLVSHWNSHRSTDYVSFKIVLDNRWKRKALDASTWPKRIKFREFVKRQIDTWKPVF